MGRRLDLRSFVRVLDLESRARPEPRIAFHFISPTAIPAIIADRPLYPSISCSGCLVMSCSERLRQRQLRKQQLRKQDDLGGAARGCLKGSPRALHHPFAVGALRLRLGQRGPVVQQQQRRVFSQRKETPFADAV